MEETSKVPSLQDGSTSVTDDEGAAYARSRCRRPKWTREEEMVLVEAHCTLGNAWVAIAECLPGRTPSEVKNIWHSTLRARKLQTRSVLRAYVIALKDRADKPAARQQAMRAAQHFLSESSAGKACSPAKRGPRRAAGQKQQQQRRLPQLKMTGTAASPPLPAAVAAGGVTGAYPAEQEAGVAGSRFGGAVREALVGGSDAPAATIIAAAAPAVAGPATGHRSSLGSEWSCVSSGALESWPPAATNGGGGADFPKAPTPPPSVISYSPLVNAPAAQPPAAAARVSAAAAVVKGSRFDSPALRPDSPPPPGSHPPTGAGGCGSSDCRVDVAKPAALPPSATAAWLAPPLQPQPQHRLQALWPCASRESDSVLRTAAAAWDQAPVAASAAAAPPRWGYVVSTGCGGGAAAGAADSCELRADDGRRALAGLPGGGGAATAAASVSLSLHSYGSQASMSKLFPAAGARSAAAVAAQLRGAIPAVQPPLSGFCARGDGSGGGRDVVTLGLYGITDEELLACLRT